MGNGHSPGRSFRGVVKSPHRIGFCQLSNPSTALTSDSRISSKELAISCRQQDLSPLAFRTPRHGI